MNVLVVDDIKFNVEIVKQFLQFSFPNVTVESCFNGKEAVEKTLQKHYDVILMDLQMPELNGQQATAAIRKNSNNFNHQTPIIALTVSSYDENALDCFEVGMNDFMAKPIQLKTLRNKVCQYISISDDGKNLFPFIFELND
jgi:CheY-like chemotaxis protein